MAIVTREQIMRAMIELLSLKCKPAFATVQRTLMTWEELTTAIASNGTVPDFPALYLFDGIGFADGGKDSWTRANRGTPPVRTLNRTLVMYARQPGAGTPGGINRVPGGQVLHPLIEIVEAAMYADDPVNNVLTLGGLVYNAWIEGEGFMYSGDLDPTGLCMQTIPLRIVIP